VGLWIGASFRARADRRRAATLALFGAIAGTMLGWVLVSQLSFELVHWGEASAHMSNMILQTVGAFCGILRVHHLNNRLPELVVAQPE
jgi:hypothetical protein